MKMYRLGLSRQYQHRINSEKEKPVSDPDKSQNEVYPKIVFQDKKSSEVRLL
jgi:hypothetical protein